MNKLGIYFIDYEQLEKTVPNSSFVVALLLGLRMYDKNSYIIKKLAMGRKVEFISPEDVRHMYKEVNVTPRILKFYKNSLHKKGFNLAVFSSEHDNIINRRKWC